MTVEHKELSSIFPNIDFDDLSKFVTDKVIKGDCKLRPHERGSVEDNIFEDCKNHNLAVNAKFTNVGRNGEFLEWLKSLQDSLLNSYKDCQSEVRNSLYYESGDYMGWHTNKYSTGDRIYLIWSEKSKASYFDYYDGKKIQSIAAPKGWSINTFYCGQFERQLTHQVRADCKRMSIGFRLK